MATGGTLYDRLGVPPTATPAAIRTAFRTKARQVHARVANSIWKTAADPGFGPGYEAGHHMSAPGDLVVLLTGLGFAAAAAATRRVNPRVALLAAVLVIIPPPFFWPAAGVLFLLLHALTTGRSLPTESAL